LAQSYHFKLLVHTPYVKDTSIKWSKIINDQLEDTPKWFDIV